MERNIPRDLPILLGSLHSREVMATSFRRTIECRKVTECMAGLQVKERLVDGQFGAEEYEDTVIPNSAASGLE